MNTRDKIVDFVATTLGGLMFLAVVIICVFALVGIAIGIVWIFAHIPYGAIIASLIILIGGGYLVGKILEC